MKTTRYSRAESDAFLDLALRGLTYEDRELLLLRYYPGMPLADAAEIAGMTPEHASKRSRRAVKKLVRNCMETIPVDSDPVLPQEPTEDVDRTLSRFETMPFMAGNTCLR